MLTAKIAGTDMSIEKTSPSNIFLVGPMGVGKTTIGRSLAEELRLEFVDCDVEIEARCGAEIAWIFDVEGEAGFRDREMEMLAELTDRDNILLATGGGAVLRKENRDYLKKRGTVVFLDSSVESLVKRTAKDKKRPLLQNVDPAKVLRRIKTERDPLYREIADIRLYVGDKSSRRVVQQVVQLLNREGKL